MASDQHHRSVYERARGTASGPSGPALPPAAGYLDAAKNLLAGQFRYGAKPPRDRSPAVRPDPVYSNLRGPPLSQTTSHRIEVKINALDINEDRTHAILAGRRVLKTVRVDGERCLEEFDLRASAIEHAHGKKSSLSLNRDERALVESRQRETQGIEDVSWSTRSFSSHIATAGSNGKVILWDLHRPEVELARLHEHQRQVHSVEFSRADPAVLLSGSQDATVKLWDLRWLDRDVMTCPSRAAFSNQTDGVRDVKWSPTDPTAFAVGTESGSVSRWDVRFPTKPQLKIAAHDKPCTTIAWHVDGKHLVSGGRDRKAKVWDLWSNYKRQKAKYYIRAPHEVHKVSWRPPCNISESSSSIIWQCAQLAIAYEDHPVVHIWDWRRDNLPHRELYFPTGDNGPADMLWHSKDLLWTVGHGEQQGDFAQSDVQFVPKKLDRSSLQTLAMSSTGEAVLFAQPRFNSSESTLEEVDRNGGQLRPTRAQKNFMSRSPGDDSLDDNFLSAPSPKGRLSRTPSLRSNRSQDNTPPPEDPVKAQVLKLDQILRRSGVPAPHQWSKSGPLPGIGSTEAFIYLAQKYKIVELRDVLSNFSEKSAFLAFEQNAGYSQLASLYREAQAWRIFGAVASKHALKNAKANRSSRLVREAIEQTHLPAGSPAETKNTNPQRRPSTAAGIENHHKEESKYLKVPESSSNVPTPVAKPFDDKTTARIDFDGTSPGVPTIDDDLRLPPSLVSPNFSSNRTRQKPADSGTERPGVRRVLTTNTNWHDSSTDRDERLAKVSQWRAAPKTPFNLTSFVGQPEDPDEMLRLERQDSIDSFTMFSGSGESHPTISKSSSFASRPSQGSMPIPVSRNGGANSSHDGSNSDKLSFSPEKHFRSSMGESSGPFDSQSYGSELYRTKSDATSNSQESSKGRSYMKKQTPESTQSFQSTTYNSSQSSQQDSFPNGTELSASGKSPPNALKSLKPERHEQNVVKIATGSTPLTAPAKLQLTDPSEFENAPFTSEDFVLSPVQATNELLPQPNPTDMLQNLLKWYSSRSNAQMASHLILCWQVLLGSLPLPPADPDRFFDHDSQSPLTRSIHAHLRSLDISPAWLESILSTYHDHLMAFNLLSPATQLRRLTVLAFPSISTQSRKDTDIGILCRACKNPINNPAGRTRCETCKQRQAPCPICWQDSSPFPHPSRTKSPSATVAAPSSSLWTTCLLCAHSAHAACLATWHADPAAAGACPVPSCACDCARGRLRDERLVARAKRDLARKTATAAGRAPLPKPADAAAGVRRAGSVGSALGGGLPVRRDMWDVAESQAVGRARSSLTGGGRGERGGKRVRLVVPDEEEREVQR